MISTDSNTTLAQLKQAMAAFARERDWEQFHAPKNLSMAIATEAAELMEPFLWMSVAESSTFCTKPEKKAKIEEELADVMLFALQFANMTGIDISTAVQAKIVKNMAKYPIEKAKGRSAKYTEL